MVKKATLLLLITFITFGCSFEYTRLSSKVRSAVTPNQIIETSIDIGLSDISDENKNKLYQKLMKQAINVFRLYVEFAVSGEKLPNKDEIKDILKFLAKNIDKLNNKELIEQTKYIIEKLSSILMDNILK